MAFLVSPGVQVREIDLTNVIPAVSTSIGAIAGAFEKGPVGEITLVSSEEELVRIFGKPNSTNFETFFAATNFLQYGNALQVVRVETGMTNAVAAGADVLIRSTDDYLNKVGTTGFAIGNVGEYTAREPGTRGNSIGISLCGSATAFSQGIGAASYGSGPGQVNGAGAIGDKTVTFDDVDAAENVFQVGDLIDFSSTNTVTTVSAISAAAVSSNVVTYTIPEKHGIKVGDVITVVGVGNITGASADGTDIAVTGITNTTVTADLTIGDGSATINGNASLKVTTPFTAISGDEGNKYEVTSIDTGNSKLTIRLDGDPNGAGLQAAIPDNSFVRRRWRFHDLFDGAPGTSDWATANNRGTGDEMHLVVYDTTGDITGFDFDVAGNRLSSVIETFAFMSKNPVARKADGTSNYYFDRIYAESSEIYAFNHTASGSNWGTDTTTAYTAVNLPVEDVLGPASAQEGTDDFSPTVGELDTAYTLFEDADTVDVNLIIAGAMPTGTDGVTHASNLMAIADTRKDVVVFLSPQRSDVVGVLNSTTATQNVIDFYDQLPSSSYAVFDSGYKYQYDKYNDVYRFIPLNGDIAGLCANTDQVADAFFSPAGFNRGQIRGSVKLAYNPTQAQRDELYKKRINPVITLPGQGTVLFGDKTAQTKPSAFDRINVRRLFILLEKAIATAAKFQLFEFNDEFTRAQFRNIVEPFLRDIQGRRGITDFSVVCDETNNTGNVVDSNQFVADIFIKPARSINFITLNFVAVRTGVAFSEIGG